MEYLDERIIGLPNCSKDNLRKQIADLEINNFGHITSTTIKSPSLCLKKNGVKQVYSGKNGFISKMKGSN